MPPSIAPMLLWNASFSFNDKQTNKQNNNKKYLNITT